MPFNRYFVLKKFIIQKNTTPLFKTKKKTSKYV